MELNIDPELEHGNHCEIVIFDDEVYDADDVVTLANGDRCLKDDARYVDSLEEWYHEDEVGYVDNHDQYFLLDNIVYSGYSDQYYLIDDAVWSTSEGTYIAYSDATEINGDYYPSDSDDICSCDHCGECYDVNNGPECSCCESPFDKWKEDPSYEAGYGDKPEEYPEFKDGSNEAMLGIELEVELNESDRTYVLEALWESFKGRAYPSHDGSLDDGVEFIFAPHHLSKLQEIQFEKMKELELRAYDTTTCGMHVHITKPEKHSVYEDLTKFLINFFVINRSELMRISRRKESATRYCNFHESFDAYYYGDRYTAINCRRTKTNTIEFRLFRGTLTKSAILSNAEFAHALYHYGLEQVIREDSLPVHDWNSLKAYILKNEAKYPHISKSDRL